MNKKPTRAQLESSTKGAESASREQASLQLVERFRAPLISYFFRRIGTKSEAEDLTHEVLLRVLSKHDFEALENPDGFIFQTATNLLRDRARRARTRRERKNELENSLAQAEVFSPERVMNGRQELKRVLLALKELPAKTRNIFMLHRLEGLKYYEIADLYGISTSAVEKHLIKALAHLAKRSDK